MDNYVNIGSIVATFGVKGELVIQHHLGPDPEIEGLKVIFIETIKDKFVPYFIKEIKQKTSSELLVLLEDLDSPEAAKKYLKKKIWISEQAAKKISSKSAPLSLLGFDIVEKKKLLGKVLEVIEQPHQLLLRIEIDGKEVLIPVNESTLIKIDHKAEKIHVSLPDGLLDIYLT
jgi:16S rRNA processing protein RimM